MTQPVPAGTPPAQASGSSPAAWGLPGPLPATQTVPGYGSPGRDLVYVRSPITGDVRGVSAEEATTLVHRAGWEPVVEPGAVRLLERQVARETANPYEAALYGVGRGLSGGLVEGLLPQGEEPGALRMQGIREAYPGTALAGEIGGSLLPLSKVAGALRFASPVALAAGAGEAVAGLGEGAGFLGRVAARTAGTALEGGLIGSTYEVGQSKIEDSPLTAQKIAGGFLAGALPGAAIGLPLGVVEGLGARFAGRAEGLQKQVLDPALSDTDMMKIAHREHGVAVPGMIEELQAAIQKNPDLSPEVMAMMKDKGAVGKQVREELLGAQGLREGAEKRAADGLNAVQELDDQAIQGWIHGQPKKELIQEWMKDAPPAVDVDAAMARARNIESAAGLDAEPGATRVQAAVRAEDINVFSEAVHQAALADPALKERLMQDLAVPKNTPLDQVIAHGMLAQDDNVAGAIHRAMAEANPAAKAAFSKAARSLAEQAPEVMRWRAQGLHALDSLGVEAEHALALSPGVLGQARSEARKVKDLLANARLKFQQGDRANAFAALDELKGRLGPHAKPGAWLGQDDNVARFVRRGYEDVRQILEDPSLWGERAASAQREMNGLLHRRLARADGYFKQFFEDAGVPHPRNPWVNAKIATPRKVNAALKGIIDPDKSDALAMFKGHVAETRELAQKMRDYYHLTPEAEAGVSKLLRGVDQADEAIGHAVGYARREAQAGALFNARGNVVPGYAKWMALGLLGPLGFAAARGAEMVANPGQAIFHRAVLERVLRGSESRMAKAVLALVSGKTVKFPNMGATQLAARGSVSLLREKDPKKRAEGYASSLAELSKLADPRAAIEHATKALPFAPGTVPGAPQQVGLMLSRAANYVLSKAPVRPRLTARGIEVDLPSDTELHDFEQVWSGAFDPISAVEDAATGFGSLDAMHAAEQSAPELVQEVRALVQFEIGNHDVPHDRLVDLSIVLGMPLDATLEPEYISAQQMIHSVRFKESEAQGARRNYQEDGVNSGYKTSEQTAADRLETDTPPK